MSTIIEHETQQPVVAVVSKTTTALAVVTKSIEEINAIGTAIDVLDTKYKGVVFPVTTTQGMDDAKKARAAIREPRYAIQNMATAAKGTLNDLKNSVDEQAGIFIERIAAIEQPIHDQIKNEETRKADEKKARVEAEARRVAGIQARIDALRTAAIDAVGKSSGEIAKLIETVDGTAIDESFAELCAQAEGAKSTALVRLRMMLTAAETTEKEQQRLADERAEFERKQAHERQLAAIRERIRTITAIAESTLTVSADSILQTIALVRKIAVDDTFGELREEAQKAHADTISRLETAHANRVAFEAEQMRLADEREAARVEAEKAEKREAARKKIHEIKCWIVSSIMAATPEAYDRAISSVKGVALDEQTFGDLIEDARAAVESTLAKLTQDRAELVETLTEQVRIETDRRRQMDILAIRNQLALAVIGSSDENVSNARRLVTETLVELLDTDVSVERFGDRAEEAAAAKDETHSKIRDLVAKLDQREAAEQRAAREREEFAERQRTFEANQKRLDYDRAELDRRQAEPVLPEPSPAAVEAPPAAEAAEASETPDDDSETTEAPAPPVTDVVTPTTVSSFDGRVEPEAAATDRRPLTVSDPSALDGLKCQEASVLSFATYIPCGATAAAVVWHEKDKRAYIMCAECAWHNVKNRGGRLLMATDQRAIP